MHNKYTLLILSTLFFAASCQNKEKTSEETVDSEMISESNPHTASGDADLQNIAEITWKEVRHNFGKVHFQQKVFYNFQFTNTGKTDLIIVDAQATCGCTTPEWPKEPIKPNETGSIKVGFKSTSTGAFNKQITVTANTVPDKHPLTIVGEVLEEEN